MILSNLHNKIFTFDFYFCIISFFAFLISCSKKEVIVYRTLEKIDNIVKPKKNSVSPPVSNKISWEKPNNWQKVSPGNMQIAKFLLNKEDNDHVSIATFPGDVGGMMANVNRWRRQLSLSPINQENIKLKNYKGDYFNFKVVKINNENKSIVVAIFEKKGRTTFVKMVAKNSVAKQKYKEFIDFCFTIK